MANKKIKIKQSDILYILQSKSKDRHSFEMYEWEVIDSLREMYRWALITPEQVRKTLGEMYHKGVLKQRGQCVSDFTCYITSSKYLK